VTGVQTCALPICELQASKSAIFTCKFSLKLGEYLPDGGNPVYLLHRLDSPVSGLILVALNEKISRAVGGAFENRTVQKKYLALLKGHLPNEIGCWRSNISKVRNGTHVRASSFGDLTAITRYRLISEFSWQNLTLSFAEIQPITGRTHQIRLHCSQNGVPLVGDKTYGDFHFNRRFYKLTGDRRLFLHSNEITAQYSLDGMAKNFHVKSRYPFLEYCANKLIK
jgi:23S rRNA-/tRNA-specific pseudouridylate synthase